MRSGGFRWFRPPWLAAVAALPVLWHVVALVRVFASRLTYPMDVEWMEGGVLYEAHRLVHGETLYGPPESFVPFGYGPLHPSLLASLGAVVGVDYWLGRLVSIVAVVAASAVLFREIWRHAGHDLGAGLLGLLGVGAALAAFPVTGGWYDLVRNDSLALALPIVAAALVSDGERLGSRRRWLAVALLMVATVFAKQTGILFVAWIWLYALVTNRRAALRMGAAAGMIALGLTGALQIITRGWFVTWTTVMVEHDVDTARFSAAIEIVVEFAPYLLLLPPLVALLLWKGWLSGRGVLWLGMLVAAIPVGLLPYAKMGGYLNNLMPVVFLAGPVSIVLAIDLLNGLQRAQEARLQVMARAFVIAGLAALLLSQRYSLDPYVPDAEQRQAAEDLNAFVQSLEGGVLMPTNPYIAVRNGHEGPQSHTVANYDAVFGGVPGSGLDRFLANADARWVFTHPSQEMWLQGGGWPLPGQPIAIEAFPMTGTIIGPTHLYDRYPRPPLAPIAPGSS